MTGKIIKGIAGFYYVHDGKSRLYECKAKGVFRNKKIKPLVGDDVEFSVLDEEELTGNIDRILPRKNALVRPAAANVEQAMVVFSITHPAPNLNLLDRFLVMMERQQVPVVICFNKVDLCEGDLMEQYGQIYRQAGYEVEFISTVDKRGLDRVRERLQGKTTVLAGPSGVGKSSLTNELHPDAAMETGDISRKIERGKHTTATPAVSHRGGHLHDGHPGVQLHVCGGSGSRGAQGIFPEFAAFEEGCKFLGCVHVGEKVCGVKEALSQGKLARSRYDNYLLMYQELKNKRRY